MKNFFSKTFAAFLTFFLGAMLTSAFFIFSKSVDRKPEESNLEVSESAVSETSMPTPEKSESELESLSPYDIESFINSNPTTKIEKIWEKLQIADNYNGTSHYDSEKRFFTECEKCQAKTYDFEFDGQPGDEVLLQVEDKWRETSRYLIFKYKTSGDKEEQWQLLGHIDHDFGRYQMPQHYFLLSGGKTWLLIRVQEVSGSASLYNDRLFTIDNRKLVEVIVYPAAGHQGGYSFPENSFNTRLIEAEIKDGVATVKVEFTINYSTSDGYGNETPLWNKKQKAVFKINLNSNKVTVDANQSNVSKREIEMVYGDKPMTDEDFLRYNFEELKQIALGKQSPQKAWLQNFLLECKLLQNCEPSPERESLHRYFQ